MKIKFSKENLKDLLYLLILGLFIYLFMFMRLPYYIDKPGNIDDISKYITIDDSYKPDSTLNSTYVDEFSKVNLSLYLYSFLNKDWDVVKISDELAEGQSESDAKFAGKADIESSRDYAIISAYKLANKSYKVNGYKLYAIYIFPQAKTDLKVGDSIKSINGIAITSGKQIKELIQTYKDGDKLNIIANDNDTRYAIVFNENNNNYIGIQFDEDFDLEEDPKVTYNIGDNVSGPSAGFMMSLYIYSNITNFDLPDNLVIAGTGTIDSDGNVGPIGGVKYKIIGAANNGASVFFVPSDNYDEAVKVKEEHKFNIDVVKVDTLSDAIKYLESKR